MNGGCNHDSTLWFGFWSHIQDSIFWRWCWSHNQYPILWILSIPHSRSNILNSEQIPYSRFNIHSSEVIPHPRFNILNSGGSHIHDPIFSILADPIFKIQYSEFWQIPHSRSNKYSNNSFSEKCIPGGEMIPTPPVGVFWTLLEPPKCHIIQKMLPEFVLYIC